MYEAFEPRSRIRWLRDTDGDGHFEDAQTFVDGLRFPTDIKVWRDGILICDAPDILFARDTNGDGKADETKKLFSGFEIKNAQARVNSLRWGLDNWLYGACGLFGGEIKSHLPANHLTGKTIDCNNRDFRLNPDTGAIEPVSGRTQQGRCRNDWGDWFGCSNGTLMQAIPSDDRYLHVLAALSLLCRKYGPFTNETLKTEKIATLQPSQRAKTIASLISARNSATVQQAAIRAIDRTGATEASSLLLTAYTAVGPESRLAIVDVLMSRSDSALKLLSAAASGVVRPNILDATRRNKLLSNPNHELRNAAKRILTAGSNSNRNDVVKSFESAVNTNGDAVRGKSVFRKQCANCHRLEDHGHVVGPDLMALTNRDPRWLLTTMLDPNKDVDARYVVWTALTKDGRTMSGMIVKESANSILLREAGGKEHVIPRNELEAFQSSERSLMPEGLERDMSAADFRDVIAYLSQFESAVTPLPKYPPEIAPFLLNESQPAERRQKVIDQRPGMGPDIISLLAANITAGDTDDEYRHIPWLWRVAIAVGKRNDGGEIRDVLASCVPAENQPLQDWQAVVIGGGLINGLSQLGVWPARRHAEILSQLPAVQARWPRTLQLAAAMANNEQVKTGTRYDALRMVALMDPDVAVPRLLRYLTKDANRELQMGAVSGLVDIESSTVIAPLTDSLKYLEGRNRYLAIEGLLRTDKRADSLRNLIEAGTLKLTVKDQQSLLDHPVDGIRTRAKRAFAVP